MSEPPEWPDLDSAPGYDRRGPLHLDDRGGLYLEHPCALEECPGCRSAYEYLGPVERAWPAPEHRADHARLLADWLAVLGDDYEGQVRGDYFAGLGLL